MNKQSFAFALVLFSSLFPDGVQKRIKSPTDEEILGSIVKPETPDEYIYPVRPGTPEWGTLANYDEMLKAVELPDSVLQNISTWGLAETCFNYPLSGDYSAHNNQVGYISDLIQSFNGLRELFSREDISIVLLYNYRHIDFALYPSFLDRDFIELLIGSDSFLSKLNHRQLQYLVSVSLVKADYQKMHFESSMPPYSYYIMANGMIHYGYKPFINYCSSNTENSSAAFFLWGINAQTAQIGKYAEAFVNN